MAQPASLLWHLRGRRPDVQLDTPRIQLSVHLVNRTDRTMFAGPFLLVPLPVIPVFPFDRHGGSVVEEAYEGTEGGRVDEFVTLWLRIATVRDGDQATLATRGITIERNDGSVLRPESGRRFARTQGHSYSVDLPIGREGAWFDVHFAARIPVAESFTLHVSDVRVNDEPVEIPPIRYGPGREWVLGAGGL
jgi:hypothetical protein